MKTLYATFMRLMLALALSLQVSVPQAAYAMNPSGHKFCENGMGSPETIARKVEVANAADPSGSKITLAGCKTTARLLLQAFQATKSGSRLTSVQELPAFLRKLKPMTVKPDMEFEVSCLWDTANGREVKMACETRPLRPGEVVYGDPATRELLIMSSCANPGVAEAPPIAVTSPCLEIRFPSMGVKTAIRFAYISDKPLPGKCHKYQLAGERNPRFETPEECPDTYEAIRGGRKVKVVCSWSEVEAASSRKLGRPVQVQNVSGSFYTRADGTNSWFVSEEAMRGMAAICWELPNGEFVTLGVTGKDYVNQIATITPEQVRTLRWTGN